MKAFTTDQFPLPLPESHTFPAAKYGMLRERVLAEGIVAASDLVEAPAATLAELALVHDPEYIARVVSGALDAEAVRVLGLLWTPELVERSRRSTGATVAAARVALDDGVAVNLAGGTHHAFRDRGAGYCVFNDAAVAARTLQAQGRIDRVAILDCDVHQGDGTALIFADDPSVFTLSIHGARNYPLRKQASDLDIELPDHTGDDAYLEAVERGVRTALATSRPELGIYLAGADPYVGDRLGRLDVSAEGLARRDRLVFDLCREAGVPLAVAMAGGYARVIAETVAIQARTVAEAARSYWEWAGMP